MRSTLLSAALVASLPATPLAAQVTTVDEGSFSITRNGAPAGREEFSIRKTPGGEGGAVYVASATVAYDGRRLSPALRADATGSPLAYQVEVKVGSEVQERLTGQVGRGRFSALTKTPRGESAKEYVVSDGALILDDDVFHQYFFVAQSSRVGGSTVAVVVPRRNAQLAMRVDERGGESVTVGGRALSARHLVLREGAAPGGAERDVWVDAQGRVLKVSIPSRGIVALRDEPPR
jgi:hypothetical protein